jgi:hypothetical protein
MLSQYIRVIHSDNATLTDYSLQNEDITTTLPFAIVAAQDYYYLGFRLPTNNFFIQIDTANDEASVLSVQYWDQSTWRDGVDVLDGTSTSGVTFAKNGVVQFSPDSRYQWAISADALTGVFPTELSTLNITNVYWLRLKFSANLAASTAVKRIAYAFTSTQNVNAHDVFLQNYYTSIAAGKTNWDDEIILASMRVVRDLKKKMIIYDKGQILNLEDVAIPCEHKTREIIYYNLGGDYADKVESARKEYLETINAESLTLDTNRDGRVSYEEINNTRGAIIRRR